MRVIDMSASSKVTSKLMKPPIGGNAVAMAQKITLNTRAGMHPRTMAISTYSRKLKSRLADGAGDASVWICSIYTLLSCAKSALSRRNTMTHRYTPRSGLLDHTILSLVRQRGNKDASEH